MSPVFQYIGFFVGLVSVGFAYWQWRERIRVEELQIKNLRSLWDLASSHSPFRFKLDQLLSRTDDWEIAAELRKLASGVNTMVRLITPMYAEALGKKLTYDYIDAMICSGEIGGIWTLRLLLMELPSKKRDKDREEALISSFPLAKTRLNEARSRIYESAATIIEERARIRRDFPGPDIQGYPLEDESIDEPDNQESDLIDS